LWVALFGVGLTFFRPVPAGVWHDDGVYLLIGKALSEGQGLSYLGVVGEPSAVKFPPGYSVLLAVLWWIFGSLRSVTIAAVLLNFAFLATAGVALAWALHRTAKLSRWVAVGLSLLAFFSADVWRAALVPLSEPLFLMFALGALALWPGEGRRSAGRRTLMLAVVLTLAVLTRSAGLAVVLGFGVALVLTHGWRRAALSVTPGVAAIVGWWAFASSRSADIPVGMRDVLGPYGGWLIRQVTEAPGTFLEVLPAQALTLLGRTASLLLPGVYGGWLWAAAVPVAVLAVVGSVVLYRRLPPVPWVIGAYAAMLLLWPFVDRRLIVPLHPLLVVSVGVGVLELADRWTKLSARRVIWTVGFLWMGLSVSVSASRAARGWAVAGYQLRAGRLAGALEALEQTAPRDAVVGAPEFWAALHLHGGWPVTPSALFTPRTEDEEVPVWGTPGEQLDLWWTAGVNHLLLEQGGKIHGEALNLLEASCPGDVLILARMDAQMLVRLQWDADCVRELGLEG
jgi:hypothetical protein